MSYFKKGSLFSDNDGFSDPRMMRPVSVMNKKNNSTHLLQPIETIQSDKNEISFFKPNIVALFANIANQELKSAKTIYNESIHSKISQSGKIDFKKEEHNLLFDYFEKVQMSIVAIYTAVEAFANIAIPNDYKIEKRNSKNIIEIWEKENIERWINTSEKISDILPSILNVISPKKLKIWSYFKSLENIRNDIIHPKATSGSKKIDMNFLNKLLKENIFKTVESGFGIIQYFCQKDNLHPFFPMGFSDVLIQTIELDDFEEYFEINDN